VAAKNRTKDSQSLKGKVALVTGANRGIGLAVAHALAAAGCDVVITGRDWKTLARAEKELKRWKVRVFSAVCDVRDSHAVGGLASEIKKKFRRIDILINNAGIIQPNLKIAETPLDVWRDVIDINLTGTFIVTKAVLPLMKRGGIIVNNLSIVVKQTFTGTAAYNASKLGALAFTNTLREELREKGIRVLAFIPGAVDTDIWNTLWAEAPRHKMVSAETVAKTLLNALLLPENSAIDELTITPSTGAL
jgi:NAD(P)-dependent dehydrogenase (short-subunit alcohol dehydrogenase family)